MLNQNLDALNVKQICLIAFNAKRKIFIYAELAILDMKQQFKGYVNKK